ncbi:MAG TPA: peptidylprolyl isomerase [Polyangiaceae bacterium]|jgi:peptidyl-prolyl cis-trans isomerase A (cyclophilin A)|nr:peptidylprolyl isomerase [Polyangiaceae bacterium]
MHQSSTVVWQFAVPALLSLVVSACEEKVPEPAQKPAEKSEQAAETKTPPKPAETASAAPAAPAVRIPAKPTATVAVSPGDPVKGVWTLDDATKGLPKDGKLVATIDTEAGKLTCELFDDKAPITVANFVGLARGIRPWKTPEGSWAKKPLYNGTVFHRIIKGFMIQGGDPKGNGSGDPGYVIPDEIWENGSHDARGLLCMANRGPDTNGAQFFILDAPSTYLDGKYTIFGKCEPGDVIEKLASHKVVGDQAVDPPKIKKVTIERSTPKP